MLSVLILIITIILKYVDNNKIHTQMLLVRMNVIKNSK